MLKKLFRTNVQRFELAVCKVIKYDVLTAGLPWSGKSIWNMIFFQVREKSGNFVDGLGNLERTWKVREKSGNLKMNGYGGQFSENFIYSVQEGKGCSLRKSKPISVFIVGLLLKERICSHGDQILSCKSNPKFEVIQLAPLK